MNKPDVKEHLGTLCRVLDDESGGYQALLTLLNQQRQAAIEARFGPFVESVGKKDALLKNLRNLENERQQVMEALAKDLHAAPAGLNVSQLIELLPGPEAEKLNTCRHRLRTVIEQVRAQNKTNQDLLRHLLELMKKALDMLGGKVPGEQTYCEKGQVQGSKLTGTMLHGEI